jgi:hypothetical protein|tara:strand:- start:2723 stop:2995 length:273 start_codon:yes stop_codon:yes gene_type:complete
MLAENVPKFDAPVGILAFEFFTYGGFWYEAAINMADVHEIEVYAYEVGVYDSFPMLLGKFNVVKDFFSGIKLHFQKFIFFSVHSMSGKKE